MWYLWTYFMGRGPGLRPSQGLNCLHFPAPYTLLWGDKEPMRTFYIDTTDQSEVTPPPLTHNGMTKEAKRGYKDFPYPQWHNCPGRSHLTPSYTHTHTLMGWQKRVHGDFLSTATPLLSQKTSGPHTLIGWQKRVSEYFPYPQRHICPVKSHLSLITHTHTIGVTKAGPWGLSISTETQMPSQKSSLHTHWLGDKRGLWGLN